MLDLYEIEKDKLYQSGALNGLVDVTWIGVRGIRVILDFAGGLDSRVLGAVPFVYVHRLFLDLPIEPPCLDLVSISKFSADMIRGGSAVLSHCAFGKNRSGFVSGLILHELHPAWCGRRIVGVIQSAVPGALSNQLFASLLFKINPGGE